MLPEGLSRSLVGAATLRPQMSANVARWTALLLEGGLLVETGLIVEPVRGVVTGVAGAGGYPKHTGSWFKINSTLVGYFWCPLVILVVEARLGLGPPCPPASCCPAGAAPLPRHLLQSGGGGAPLKFCGMAGAP